MKKIFLSIICLIFAITLNAQVKSFPKDWHLLDYKKDSVFGISLKEAYTLLSDRQPKQKTIVAVIDSGGDVNHEDLKDVLWCSKDGKHGWNYLGDSDGATFIIGTTEADREYLKYYKSYLNADTTKLSKKEMAEYHYFQKVVFPKSKIGAICRSISTFDETILLKDRFRDFMVENFKDQTFTNNMCRKAQDMVAKNKNIPYNKRSAYQFFLRKLSNKKDIAVENCADYISKYQADWRKDIVSKYEKSIEDANKIEQKRLSTGFNYNTKRSIAYGNGDVTSEVMFHGTHVGGIIGANRHNSIGIDGVADVQLMFLRVIAEGTDEADKDVATAIRYAVDNGARVINMSFGKPLSPQQYLVDDAIAYAEKKGVLLVHAAGNDAQNIDIDKTYPEIYIGKRRREANNMLTVGASGPLGGAAKFSNYGKNAVHVFAPGFNIYSTISDNKYKEMSGTSMATPVVSGIAALLLNYFPELAAKELKQIIIESGVSRKGVKIYLPNRNMFASPGDMSTGDFGDLSRSGVIVNAYQAVKMAIEIMK